MPGRRSAWTSPAERSSGTRLRPRTSVMPSGSASRRRTPRERRTPSRPRPCRLWQARRPPLRRRLRRPLRLRLRHPPRRRRLRRRHRRRHSRQPGRCSAASSRTSRGGRSPPHAARSCVPDAPSETYGRRTRPGSGRATSSRRRSGPGHGSAAAHASGCWCRAAEHAGSEMPVRATGALTGIRCRPRRRGGAARASLAARFSASHRRAWRGAPRSRHRSRPRRG